MLPFPLLTRRRRSGFTIVELLVVIGIIIILMGILLPVVKKVRYAAYTADTENEISQISNACNQYYSTFHAYPGPLSNDYIEGINSGSTTTPTSLVQHPLELYTPGATPAFTSIGSTGAKYPITASENLVLGLMGGLRLDAGNKDSTAISGSTLPYTMAIAPAEVGLGPLNLNGIASGGVFQFLSPSRTPSFLPTGSNYLMWCETDGTTVSQNTSYVSTNSANVALTITPFHDPAQTPANDSPIPEFVDRFPTPGPLPILYVRARTGAKGVISDGVVIDPVLAQLAQYQYDVREFAAYTVPAPTSPGGGKTGIGLSQGAPINQHYLQGLNPGAAILNMAGPPPVYFGIKDHLPNNAGPYFFNSTITPTNLTDDQHTNYTGRPRAVDTFILISAGQDGIYGTGDDITSFGDVSQ